MKKNEQSLIIGPRDSIKNININIPVMWVQEWQGREKGGETILEATLAENSPNLIKVMNLLYFH